MENPILKSVTKYDLETLKKFNKVHMYSKTKYKIITVLAVLLMIYSVIFINTDTYLRLFAFIIGIIWVIEITVLPGFWAKRVVKTSKIASESEVEVNFFENKIIANTIRDNENIGTSNMKYEEIYKILDTKSAMYVYISANQAFVCKKDNFEGDYEKLKELLKEKLDKKYKVK